jgi:hypothetical protein
MSETRTLEDLIARLETERGYIAQFTAEHAQQCARTLAEAIAALRASQGPGWQPMETCPRGRIVLMFAVTDTDEHGKVQNWKMATGNYSFDGEYLYWDGDRLDKPYMHRPTHWMPLPPEPSSGSGEGR